jgi:ribonucleoside-diphosphate reductase alpha chain
MERAERGEHVGAEGARRRGANEIVDAKDVLNQIADAAWRCADPGVQYDTTINEWHTCPVSGRINASNPCSSTCTWTTARATSPRSTS